MKASIPQIRSAGSSVDISVDGKQHGHLSLPNPSARSAMGTLQIPVCVIRNGEGPTATLLAGSRSDEYEGQIALHNLIESISPEDVSGCIIIAPSLNVPGSGAGSHYSPFDGKDLDHCFPGNTGGSISEQLADHVYKSLVEPAELVVEMQSGGISMMYTPLAGVHFNADNDALQKRSEECMIAFGAPYSARLLPSETGSLAHSVAQQDGVFVAVRLGGGGSAAASSINIAEIGCRNVLVQAGVLKHELVLRSTRMLEITSEKNHVIAPTSGLLQLCKDPGDDVYMGNPVARIIQPGNTGTVPAILKADRNGILMARHHSAVVEQGDCVAIVADEVQR